MDNFERNMEKLCRVCLQELPTNEVVVVSFDNLLTEYKEITYRDAFAQTTRIPILPHEPQSLCCNCSQMINIAYKLRQISEKTQVALEEMLPKIDVALLKVELDEQEISENEDAESESDNAIEAHSESELETKTEGRSFKCQFCTKIYRSKARINQHVKEKHPEQQPFECPHCSKRYLFEKRLDCHERNCSKRPKATSESKQKYICPVCGILSNKDHIKNHSKVVEKQTNPQSYICDLCGATMASRTTINNHMRFQHLNIRSCCKYCPGSFKNPSSLARHMRRHHKDKTTVMRCRMCDFVTMRESELRRHRYLHTGKKLAKCQTCGAEFSNNHKLRIHMASHSDARPFTCEICGSAFKTKKGLGAHGKTHKAYDYECPVCQRAYLTNQLMRSHAEKNHPEYQLPPPGTVISKSWKLKLAEQHLKDIAMTKGIKAEELPVQELTPVEYFQPYFKT